MLKNLTENCIKMLVLIIPIVMTIPSLTIAAPSVDPLVCVCIEPGDDVNNLDSFTTHCETIAYGSGYPRFRVREPRVGELITGLRIAGFERCDGYIDGKASCISTFYIDGAPVPSEPFMCVGVGL